MSRGWGTPFGVHVEIQPFGTTRPFRPGKPSPKNELGIKQDGAFVEFDVPGDFRLVEYVFQERNVAIILTDQPLSLEGLNPVFVKVRYWPWEFWRSRPE